MYIYLTPIVTYVGFKLVLIILHVSVNQRIPSAATHRCYKCVFLECTLLVLEQQKYLFSD